MYWKPSFFPGPLPVEQVVRETLLAYTPCLLPLPQPMSENTGWLQACIVGIHAAPASELLRWIAVLRCHARETLPLPCGP